MKPTNYEAENFRWYITRPRMKALLTGMLRRIFAADAPVDVEATETANLTDQVQAIDSSGGAVTLAIPDGATATPQFLTLIASDVTNVITVTFTTVLGMPTSIQMVAQGQIMVLYWDGLRWIQVSEAGSVAGITVETLTVTGAISILHDVTFLDAALGAMAMTLADGVAGQLKYVVLVDAANEAVITPATAAGFTITSLSKVGDVVAYLFDGTSWNEIGRAETIETLTVAGAIGLDYDVTLLDAALGAMAMTLADGVAGQVKTCVLVDATGVVTITPATAVGFTAFTMQVVGDTATFVFDGVSWNLVARNATVETLAVAGAIDLDYDVTLLDAALGAMAMTLADGVIGQVKTCVLIDATAAVTITPATPIGFANIVLQNVGESVSFIFDGVSWNILSQNADTQEALTVAGAIGLDTDITLLDATLGAMSMTLADGVIGQIKHIVMVNATGDVDVTIATPGAILAIPIFGNIGDRLTLTWDGAAWQPLMVSLSADTTHTGAGAVPITHPIVIGRQELIVQIVAFVGVPTITPATATYFATIAFAGINDTARFRFTGGAWMCIGATGGVTVT